MTVGIQNTKLVDRRLAGDDTYYLWPPKDIDMRIPDRLTDCVGFVAKDAAQIRYGGTAFIVGIKGRSGGTILHLVTAAHVARAVENGPWLLGINTVGGQRGIIKSGELAPPLGQRWWYHPTESSSVDAAVMLLDGKAVAHWNFVWIEDTMFATDETIRERSIGIGDEVVGIGLFTKFSGSSKHWPIVRTGNLAMMPSDPIPVEGYDPMQAYLVEGRSIGGLSGSPVWVRDTIHLQVKSPTGEHDPIIVAGLGRMHMLGLIHGHWDIPVGFDMKAQAEAVNMGISIVVPAKKILEVLNHPELVEIRKRVDDRIIAENTPTPDSEFGPVEATLTQGQFEAALRKVSRKVKPE